jgi:hypothetical protein
MPLGTGHYNLGGQFAFPRSYVYLMAWNISGYTVRNLYNTFFWTYNLDPCIEHTIVLDPTFYPWSSNRRTLDHVVSDYYYVLTCGGARHYPGFSVNYFLDPTSQRLGLEFRYETLDFGVYAISQLPVAPPDYWVAPPL